MEAVVQQIVSGDGAAAEAGTTAVLNALTDGQLSVLGLVALLKRPLTDEQDHEGRARAVTLLSKVVSEAPGTLHLGDVPVMADFLSAKLQDWRCVEAAAPGCLALLQRNNQQQQLAPLPADSTLQLIKRFCSVHIQGLVYRGRLTCYQLLLEILQGPYGVAAVQDGTNLVEFTVVSVENEADPRCLIWALRCVQATGQLYQHQDLQNITHLTDGLEDLFDVGVVPYFPMMFTPPKNDTNNITRDELLSRVIGAMACCPQFAALGIPLLSEKLGSTHKPAKADSLQALPICVEAWGPAAVKPHLQAVWLMLKAELMAPATIEALTSDQLSTRIAAAKAAAAALTQCIIALGPGSLDQKVLSDVIMEDLMQYLGLVNPPWSQKGDELAVGPGVTSAAEWDLPDRAQKRLVCIARIVAAVAAAGLIGSSTSLCKDILRPALTALLEDTTAAAANGVGSSGEGTHGHRPVQANCAVLCVLHCVLTAMAAANAAAAAGKQSGSSSNAALTDLVPDIANAVNAMQQRLLVPDHSDFDVQGLDLQRSEQLQIWILLIWQDLVSLHSSSAALQQQQLDTAAGQLVQLALHAGSSSSSGSGEIKLDLDPNGGSRSYSITTEALKALTRPAGWPAAADTEAGSSGTITHLASGIQAVKVHAVPLLINLLSGSSSSSSGDQADQALVVLQAVAGSSAAAAWEVLVWLKPVIMEQLQQGNLEALCRTLPILYGSCLPVLPKDLDHQQSAAAAALSADLLHAWQQQQQSEGPNASIDAARYHSCLLLGQLVAKCSSNDQQMLLVTACEQVTVAAAAAAAAAGDGSYDRGSGALAAAMVAAARPGSLVAHSVVDLAGALATLCTAASSRSSSFDQTVSAVAAAALIHKCIITQRGSSSSSSSQVAVETLLHQQMELATAAVDNGQGMLGALQALAWISRGLAMQRHDGWQRRMRLVLRLLPLLPDLAAADSDLILYAAADFFSILVRSPLQTLDSAAAVTSGSSEVATAQQRQQQQQAVSCVQGTLSNADLGLKLSLHWQARPLWQQKTFTITLNALSEAISSSSNAIQQQQHKLVLLLAAASLITAAPAAVIDTATPQVVELLLQSLVQLAAAAPRSLSAAAAGARPAAAAAARKLMHLLRDCLLMLSDLLMSAPDQSVQGLLAPSIEQLLTALCQLARLTVPAPPAALAAALGTKEANGDTGAQHHQKRDINSALHLASAAAAVREVALTNLTGVMKMPYHLLHPYKRDVLAAVSDALDDDRRAVRKVAVACRTRWTMS